ncbi:unnamed protein product [Hermetia illucens]|uniref:Uncharacterized protein n=1 Tax=Hermetia illucens TaxID=343691 RepID=A0A7R8UT10_HERIL|nr:unnamed protein product [Hermetia illucens]
MDSSEPPYSEARYEEIKKEVSPYIKKRCGAAGLEKFKFITKANGIKWQEKQNFYDSTIFTDCNYTGIFINFGSQIKVRRIISKIRSGDENLLVFLKLSCTPRECASALSQFLHKIGKPLLPRRVQQLLIAENKGICSRTVALDALGLINDELEGTHLELFMAIMDLMKILSTVGSLRPTEVRVSHAPYLLMPLLFSTSDKLVKNWRSIADILNEMIICFDMYVQAPEIFQGIPSIPPVYQCNTPASRYTDPKANNTPRKHHDNISSSLHLRFPRRNELIGKFN